MSTPQEILKSHPLYGLDQAIVAYLTPVLERQFGDCFRRYRDEEELRALDAAEATARLGTTRVGQSVELQEELLPDLTYDPELNQAWYELLDTAQDEWEALCQLYESALAELRDLERMASAQWVAEQSGNTAHADRVRRILALDAAVSPTWLPAE